MQSRSQKKTTSSILSVLAKSSNQVSQLLSQIDPQVARNTILFLLTHGALAQNQTSSSTSTESNPSSLDVPAITVGVVAFCFGACFICCCVAMSAAFSSRHLQRQSSSHANNAHNTNQKTSPEDLKEICIEDIPLKLRKLSEHMPKEVARLLINLPVKIAKMLEILPPWPQADAKGTFKERLQNIEIECKKLGMKPPLLNHLQCPVTYEIMEYPVITADGHTYSLEAVLGKLLSGSNKCILNANVDITSIIFNADFRALTDEWLTEKEENFALLNQAHAEKELEPPRAPNFSLI